MQLSEKCVIGTGALQLLLCNTIGVMSGKTFVCTMQLIGLTHCSWIDSWQLMYEFICNKYHGEIIVTAFVRN